MFITLHAETRSNVHVIVGTRWSGGKVKPRISQRCLNLADMFKHVAGVPVAVRLMHQEDTVVSHGLSHVCRSLVVCFAFGAYADFSSSLVSSAVALVLCHPGLVRGGVHDCGVVQ